MLRYAALRLILFLVVGGVLYLVGMRNVLLLATTIIVSALAAYAFLPKQRDTAAKSLADIAARRPQQRALDARNEDEEFEDNLVDTYLQDLAAEDAPAPAPDSDEDARGQDETKPELN